MVTYLAQRIIDSDYIVSKHPKYQKEIDTYLISKGKEYLITQYKTEKRVYHRINDILSPYIKSTFYFS